LRVYRTGDRARYLADGHLEFLGRIDHQVKIRGFRIELGEIETVLSQHPAVREAVVLVRGDEAAGRRLVAYLVGDGQGSASIRELRGYLGERVPEYMIPAAFVVLDALPLTPNGKIDRRALPAPEREHREFERGYVAARTAEEEIVAGIWMQVMGLDRVGVID